MLYHYDRYPQSLIGPMEIVWQPLDQTSVEKMIWIRLHPSIFQEAWSAIRSALLTSSNEGDPPISWDDGESSVRMRDLRGDVDTFEIMGPLAGNVLRRVLRLCKDEISEKSKVGYTISRGIS